MSERTLVIPEAAAAPSAPGVVLVLWSRGHAGLWALGDKARIVQADVAAPLTREGGDLEVLRTLASLLVVLRSGTTGSADSADRL